MLGSLAPLALLGCTGMAPPPAQAAASGLVQTAPAGMVETLDAATLAGMIARGEVVLVDVRTPEEFAEGRIAGALNAPLQTFLPESIPMEAGRETILYCRSSGRSGRAAQMLAEHTGKRIRHLEGGLRAWIEAGYPVIRSPEG